MALFTITQTGQTNYPPNSIGFNEISIEYNTTHIFTKNNFTTETIPTYSDPEGDDVSKLKILTLPAVGSLLLSAVPVLANDEILINEIVLGNLTFVADVGTITQYTDSIEFDLSDVGSNSFSLLGTGLIEMNVASAKNNPPSQIGDRTENINYGEALIITRAMLTSLTTPIYIDPEGDPASMLKVTSTPIVGSLRLDGVLVTENQVIDFADIDLNKLVYTGDIEASTPTNPSFGFSISDTGSGQYTD